MKKNVQIKNLFQTEFVMIEQESWKEKRVCKKCFVKGIKKNETKEWRGWN